MIVENSKPGHDLRHNKCARVIAITSGKGGVGKSSLSLNMAISFSVSHKKVCLLDADTNLSNIHVMTGLRPENTLQEYIDDEITLGQLVLNGPHGIHIIPSASGLVGNIRCSKEKLQRYVELLQVLENNYDVIIVDTAAGIDETVLTFLKYAPENIFTITAEPTSLTDAFSLIKILKKRGHTSSIEVIVNKADSRKQADEAYVRFKRAVKKYIGISVGFTGYVINDRNVIRSIMLQKPLVDVYPESPASCCIKSLVSHLLNASKLGCHRPVYDHFMSRRIPSKSLVSPISKEDVVHGFSAMDELLDFIDSRSNHDIEQLILTINERWADRLAEQGENFSESLSEKNAFYAAMRFAQRLN